MAPQQIQTPRVTKNQTFDALQRPTSIEVKNKPDSGTAQLLMSRLYQYDQAGNITQIKSDLGTTDYGYDKLSRLTSARPDNALQTLGLPSEQYGYDAVHNRTSSGHQPGAWSYNGDNQLTQYPYLRPFTPGTQPIDTQVSYTPQGHTQKETSAQWEKSYQYNAAERLTKYQSTNQGQSSPALEASYKYDPFGRRISKSIKEGDTTQTTYFLYSEQGLMGEADEQGKLQKAYGFNPTAMQQGLWSTDPIWQANVSNASLTAIETSYHYLHTDHLGTPQVTTTKEGQISWKAQSEAFGAAGVLQSQSRIQMNLRFPGQYFDQETGTHHNFFRDYASHVGRYMQGDPIGLAGGQNVFSYASAQPQNGFDDFGLCDFKMYDQKSWEWDNYFDNRLVYAWESPNMPIKTEWKITYDMGFDPRDKPSPSACFRVTGWERWRFELRREIRRQVLWEYIQVCEKCDCEPERCSNWFKNRQIDWKEIGGPAKLRKMLIQDWLDSTIPWTCVPIEPPKLPGLPRGPLPRRS